MKHYATENFAAADLAALGGAFCDLAGLMKRERAKTAKYHVTYLATADARRGVFDTSTGGGLL